MGVFSKAKRVIADAQKDIDEGRRRQAEQAANDELARRRNAAQQSKGRRGK